MIQTSQWKSRAYTTIVIIVALLSGCTDSPIVPPQSADENDSVLGAGTTGGGSSDDSTGIAPAEVELPSSQYPPVANAGKDMVVVGGDRVILDGEGSFDSDDDELTFSWRQVTGTPSIHVNNAQSAKASLSAPAFSNTRVFEFELTVSDGNFSSTDSIKLTILPAQHQFTVDAGNDQESESGAIVTLAATVSESGSEALATIRWTQVDGPAVELTGADRLSTTFVAPSTASEDVVLIFEIGVQIATKNASDRVGVHIPAHPFAPGPVGCSGDAQCDDGVYCNGHEICMGGVCVAGANPCPQQLCNEASLSCVACSADSDCSNGSFCDGVEHCAQGVCVNGSSPCGNQLCDEAADVCVDCLSAADCNDGAYCNGVEACVNGFCQAGVAPCATGLCDENADICFACNTNVQCNDGQFCNGAEVCVNHACQSGAAPCSSLLCDEPTDRCVECLQSNDCDDGVFCNGSESCLSGVCQSGQPPCASATCSEANHACTGLVCSIQNPPFGSPQQVGTLLGSVADEASGLVASRKNHNVLWTHNDDTGDNRVFAIHVNGTLLGTYTLGTGSVDPEDIAIGPGPVSGVDYLYWGNTGDNNNVRSTIFVKRLPEPVVSETQSPPLNISVSAVDTLTFAYPTDATAPSHKDCETLLVDPLNGDFYFVTKRTSVGLVYRAAYPQSTSGVTTLQYVASIDWGGPVGGDISPDGQLIIIRRYSGNSPEASIWTRPAGGSLWSAFAQPRCDVHLASEPQGEAIAWDALGQGYYTVSENQTPGAQIPIWYFPRN